MKKVFIKVLRFLLLALVINSICPLKAETIDVYDTDMYTKLNKDFSVKEDFWNLVSIISEMTFNIKEYNGAAHINGIEELPSGLHEIANVTSPLTKDAVLTDTVYNLEIRLLYAEGTKADASKELKIAITGDIYKTIPYFRTQLAPFSIIEAKTTSECLKMLANKKCDAILINNAFLQRYRLTEYKNLKIAKSTIFEVPMCILVNTPNPNYIASILNKTFSQIPGNYYTKSLERSGIYLQNRVPSERLKKQIRIICFLFLGILLIYTIIINKIHNSRLKRQIEIDSLTHLLTLQGFEDRAVKLLRSQHFGLLLLTEFNVRDFAFVNRIYGSSKGDSILRIIGDELLKDFGQNRATLIARGYADNFYMIRWFVGSEKQILQEAEHYQEELQNVIGTKANVPIIIKSGNAICTPQDISKESIKDLISKAGYARRSTRNSMVENFSFYDEHLRVQHENEEQVENSIQKAIDNKEFVVQYQPKIDLLTGRIMGAEALVRWKTDSGGLIAPDKFIPILEKNGLVSILDRYVYRCVFSFLSLLKSENIPLVPISVNISRLGHDASEFVSHIDSLCGEFNIGKRYIELEIEERFAGGGDEAVKDLIHRLHEAGYTVSMDDFGSGESSLNMLNEMPFDIIKFDQRFLYYADHSESSKTILRYMVKMVNELNMTSLCEGVETKKHVQFLKDAGCHLAQGFYFARPLNEIDFKKFLVENI